MQTFSINPELVSRARCSLDVNLETHNEALRSVLKLVEKGPANYGPQMEALEEYCGEYAGFYEQFNDGQDAKIQEGREALSLLSSFAELDGEINETNLFSLLKKHNKVTSDPLAKLLKFLTLVDQIIKTKPRRAVLSEIFSNSKLGDIAEQAVESEDMHGDTLAKLIAFHNEVSKETLDSIKTLAKKIRDDFIDFLRPVIEAFQKDFVEEAKSSIATFTQDGTIGFLRDKVWLEKLGFSSASIDEILEIPTGS